jgi:hypothetical protein
MNRWRRRPLLLLIVLASLAGMLWASPAQAVPPGCRGYTSQTFVGSPVTIYGFATTDCNSGAILHTRAVMWGAPGPNGPWQWLNSADAFGTGHVTARVQAGAQCGRWYMVTGEHWASSDNWTSPGTPNFWRCF